ncbi:unnamed protein product [Effrenium voratum]|uniref:Uncharacterized protein n=1 Tax=Effrenium voratum TaxID=2562239 RepID=A0AA36I970_9DINO|nr:unnamed protein product [Effrenium voratum]
MHRFWRLLNLSAQNSAPDPPAPAVDRAQAEATGAEGAEFWRWQLEAIYRKRNPYKLHKVPELLARYKGEEVILYLKVCLAYDLDPRRFYANGPWPEDGDPAAAPSRLRFLRFLGLEAESEEAAALPPPRPFAFNCNSELPVRRAMGPVCPAGAATKDVSRPPFAPGPSAPPSWRPVGGLELKLPEDPIQKEDQRSGPGKPEPPVARNSAPSRQWRPPPRELPPPETPPMVRGKPLCGAKRILPMDLPPAKQRKIEPCTPPAARPADTPAAPTKVGRLPPERRIWPPSKE